LKNDFLPRLWATRKVGYLLDIIRLEGENQEIIDEIVSLSKKYGIITPYTSFLITDDVVPEGNWSKLGDETGAAAFDNAVNSRAYRDANNAQNVTSTEVLYANNQAFFMRDSFWVDAQFDEKDRTEDIVFGSSKYFELLNNNKEIAPFLAIGKNIIFTYNDVTYKVHEVDKDWQIIVPKVVELYQNYPNPFNPKTRIDFELFSSSHVVLEIYNLNGQLIRTLINESLDEGSYWAIWNGRTDKGEICANGMYVYKINADESSISRRMILLK
jgi:hypothetical protein